VRISKINVIAGQGLFSSSQSDACHDQSQRKRRKCSTLDLRDVYETEAYVYVHGDQLANLEFMISFGARVRARAVCEITRHDHEQVDSIAISYLSVSVARTIAWLNIGRSGNKCSFSLR